MSGLDAQAMVGQLVRERPARARVFERLGIDYCCGGKTPLERACREGAVDLNRVLRELAALDASPGGPGWDVEDRDWSAAPMGDLATHIVATHHAFLRRELPRIGRLMDTVVTAHGHRRPGLAEAQAVFGGLKAELEGHMLKEEWVLFPWVEELDLAAAGRPRSRRGDVGDPIAVMEHEHDDAGTALARLRDLTGGYAPPPDACNTYRALLGGLAELEFDLHRHIHEENNILFPRAREAEAALSARTAPPRPL